jgi:hypothetical protein
MKAIALTVAAVAVAALSWPTSPAHARTCFRETVNGPGRHEMIRGCSVARHHALRTSRRTVTRTTRVVTTDDYITTPVRTRVRTHRYYSFRAPREEIVGYGSSYVPPARTTYSTAYRPGYVVACGPGTSANWGYTNYYGSNTPPTCQASPSSHPAFYGGSGQFTYHPGFGWGY